MVRNEIVFESLENEAQIEDQESSWAYVMEIQLKAADAAFVLFEIAPFETQEYKDAVRSLVSPAGV